MLNVYKSKCFTSFLQLVAAAEFDGDDTMAQIQQLAQLKDQGILTQQEFDAKKKQLLGT